MDEKLYKPDEAAEVSPKTVGVFIDGSYFSGVQDCQALFIPSSSHIPDATRQIYFNLSAAKNRMRRGNPDLLLALVATGNSFSFEASEKLTRGICRLVKRCCLWVVTSGERSDPLAVAVASAVQSTLPQTDNYDEPLILAVNDASVACKGSGLFAEERTIPMTDAHENTLFLLFSETAAKELSLLQLRTLTAIALATPPPALPLSPEMLSFIERSPLPAVLFCGASLESLSELAQFVENGIPSIIVEDASPLCKLLKSAFTIYSTNSFDNERFTTWLDYELRNTVSATASDEFFSTARRNIAQMLFTAVGMQKLVYFTSLDSLENLPQKLLDVFAKSNRDSGALRRILHLAVKLDQASAIRGMNIKSLFTEEQITQIVERALAGDGKINALSALLDQNITPHVNPPVLMRWYRRTCDKHFFNAIILAHCLGRGRVHETVDTHLAHELNELLIRLSGGVAELFPPDFIFSPAGSQDRGKALQVLAVWALLLNRTELARCLAAYVPEPIAFSLILAKTARGLAHETHGWFFYEERLLKLSKDLSTTSVSLLDAAYSEAPEEAYIALCNPLEAHRGMTLTQMAYEMTAKDFIAHECCQRWVLRLLYGDMHLRNLLPYWHLPNWLKTVLGAVFVFPAVLWVTAKSSSMRGLTSSQRRHSGRNAGATNRNAGTSPWPIKNGPKPKTDLLTKSHELEMDNRSSYVNESRLELLGDSVSISDSELDDTEAPFIKKFATTLVHQGMRPVKETLRTADKLQLFYSTPITKYWLSLVFRLLYLLLFAISISLPSCGEMFTDVALWLWSFCWLLEALFVARIRLRYSHWQQMPWTMFDISCVASFLFVFLANHFTTVTWHHALMTAYTRKSVWAAFLLYQCYSTLFIYVPLSDLFGPLLVRLKLMITRDFVNFLVLISLFVFSSSIAIKAVIFPDRPYSLLALGQSVYWGWMQLFITDMSMLSQSEHCKGMRLSERDFCEKIGGYADPSCPTQSAMGFFTVFEFFVILKLISFPILYALFARTAKVVEDEATSIWKFQMYNLATEFSLRPFMPPPLTPLFLAGLVLLRVFGCISGVFYRAACAPAEHPDVVAAHESDEVDQNKPKGAASGRQHYWTQLAVNYWKAKFCATNSGCKCSVADDVSDKLNTLSITNSYATAKKPMWTIVAGTDVRRLSVDTELRPWTVLVPDYRPPSYSKPTEQFPQSLRTEVDDLAQQTISDFGKQWRQRKLSDVLDNSARYAFSLCNIGLPLNPSGRTGLSGRGNFPKFGPNREMLAVVIWETPDRKIKILATSSGVLPSEWQYGSASVTDFLLRILEEVGVTVIDVRSLSNDGRLPVRDVQESVAHVSIGLLPSKEDTDNAWRESDVWSIDLTGMDAVKATMDNYEWTAPDSPKLSGASGTFVESALRMFNF